MTPIERRSPRRFRILYIPLSQAWQRFILRKPQPRGIAGEAPMVPLPGTAPQPMNNLLLQGPETLRRQGTRLT